MSKRFETTLTEALDLTALAACNADAAGARRRGRRRAVRRRVTGGVVGLALVAGGTGVALKVGVPGDGRAENSAAARLDPADGPRNVTQIVPGAMVEAKEYPVGDRDAWVQTKNWGAYRSDVALPDLYAPEGHGSCVNVKEGIVGEQERAFVSPTHHETLPSQHYYVYQTVHEAVAAYQQLLGEMQACQQDPRGDGYKIDQLKVEEIGTIVGGTADGTAVGTAWVRTWIEPSQNLSRSNYFYFLQQGRAVEVVVFSETESGAQYNQHSTPEQGEIFLDVLEGKLDILTHS